MITFTVLLALTPGIIGLLYALSIWITSGNKEVLIPVAICYSACAFIAFALMAVSDIISGPASPKDIFYPWIAGYGLTGMVTLGAYGLLIEKKGAKVRGSS